MSGSVAHYLLLSLPSKSAPESYPSQSVEEWLERSLIGGKAVVNKIEIPSFKIGTLDSLVLQSEELQKIDEQLGHAVTKVLEVLTSLYDNNQPLVNASKKVDDKWVSDYVEHFKWKSSKFRVDKSLKELISAISEEAFQLDTDVRNAYANYTTAKSNLAAAERKQTGDLSVRSLHDIVSPSDFVLDSEHLQTLLVAVPKNLHSEFLNTYETLTPMVVPRSAKLIKEDSEFQLYSVILFKKYIADYTQALREAKFVPRDFVYSEELLNEMRKEHEVAAQTENRLKGELIRLARAAYSDITSNWFHLKSIRVFVESVLRYGLPPDFVTSIIKIPNLKAVDQAKKELVHEFGYLGGNAFSVDKKGKVQKDNSLNEYSNLVDTEYEPFVVYDVEIK
ncbi:H(+)-transporting V1 sector ATPase subunit C [Cyberlindnera jadinii NRRL Y-1542]|uniref:V-type proton ATPase subunit C n=1 Tax=Cyberlindnera jadinii (strain ATCC 18201 / CBS 1600 / BCRC 20928 / JCM 3617 / NBRC 0987 / NRRL Y-1542) TaxID=983966 RepID=A0A1E4RY62_CYBJN|nr:subunit C of the eight-subunit V1 peripheral membrane domain of vacuolar H+-ATPase [Cyberlindnera jadinii NRRL Y-1542]ODV72160.1 subunit C of the eight-subunit V1 peripheral membrane domain of vacuolar H+-ATPase [Cyberlindnera jadinii NRRL Y-1542]